MQERLQFGCLYDGEEGAAAVDSERKFTGLIITAFQQALKVTYLAPFKCLVWAQQMDIE